MNNSKKWVLMSGNVVKDELYKFGMRYDESLININEKVFNKTEFKEICTYEQKLFPDTPQDLLTYLSKYKASTIPELKALIFSSELWKLSYNQEKDSDWDWMRNTVENL
nr:2327_t:CDS:2 [Entrophospora candida]